MHILLYRLARDHGCSDGLDNKSEHMKTGPSPHRKPCHWMTLMTQPLHYGGYSLYSSCFSCPSTTSFMRTGHQNGAFLNNASSVSLNQDPQNPRTSLGSLEAPHFEKSSHCFFCMALRWRPASKPCATSSLRHTRGVKKLYGLSLTWTRRRTSCPL